MLVSSQADKISEQIIQPIISNFYSSDFEEIKNTREYFTQEAVSERGWYDLLGILSSLFDLYLESNHKDKPIIEFDRQDISGTDRKSLYDEFIEISKLQDEKNRDVLYIRKRPANTPGTRSGTTEDHWVVFYFFKNDKGQKSLLLVDTLYVENRLEQFKIDAKDFLQKENYNLYVSTTQIQQDKCSCGPIASEIVRILYSNCESVEALLSGVRIQENNIELSSFLPARESEQLFGSCLQDGAVNYGVRNETLRAADFRVAHFATALTFGMGNIISALHGNMDNIGEHSRESAKQMVEDIRSTFIGSPNNVALFNAEIEKLCQKQVSHKPKNIQFSKSATYFTIAAALSSLIITVACLTQKYIILVALIIPAIIAMYGWSLDKGEPKPASKLQGDIELENISILARETGA